MEELLEQDVIGWYMPPELRYQGHPGTQWLREGARVPPIFRGWVPVVLAEEQPAALAQADAQPAQPEPVAWMVYTQDGKSVFVTDNPTDIPPNCTALPLFTESKA